jgi:rubrerythrin
MIEDVSLKNSIEFAVAVEDNGVNFYGRLAKKFSTNQDLSNLFELLGKDEEVHKLQFSDLLNHLPEEAGISSSPEKRDYVRAMSISEFFSRHQGPFADVDKIGNRDQALERVFSFEKATLGFYQAVQGLIGNNSVLNQVIEAEKSHVTRIMKVIMTGEKFRSLQDQWP